jgi:5-methylcytosine-specific restriction enzyme subunit McrC
MKIKQVYEHSKLIVDDVFTNRHLKTLLESKGNFKVSFFSEIVNGVKFNQYVGVIQVLDLTIEILPKLDNSTNNIHKWRNMLIEMYFSTSKLKANITNKTHVHLLNTKKTILEVIIELFLTECEFIHHHGLIKKYIPEEINSYKLKGKILFTKNIKKNLVHQERFYTRQIKYSTNNVFNQVLLKALKLLPNLTTNPDLLARTNYLLYVFPELNDFYITETALSNIVYDRKSFVYEDAINFASLILLNQHPDVVYGYNNIVAVMFDMNKLWQEYVGNKLVQYCKNNNDAIVQLNCKMQFWKYEKKEAGNERDPGYVYPDIVIEYSGKKVVIDTKWKELTGNPSGDDLQQMFLYDKLYNADKTILLYPSNESSTIYIGGHSFIKDNLGTIVYKTSSLLKVGVFKSDSENVIDTDLGKKIYEAIEKN